MRERLKEIDSRGITHGHINQKRLAMFGQVDAQTFVAGTIKGGMQNDIAMMYAQHYLGEAPVLTQDLIARLVLRQPELSLFDEYTKNLSMNRAHGKLPWFSSTSQDTSGTNWTMQVANPRVMRLYDDFKAKYRILLRPETESRSKLLLISQFSDIAWLNGEQPFFVPVLIEPVHALRDVVSKEPLQYQLMHPIDHGFATDEVLAELPYQIGVIANTDRTL